MAARSSTVTMHTNLQTTACGLGELAVGQEIALSAEAENVHLFGEEERSLLAR